MVEEFVEPGIAIEKDFRCLTRAGEEPDAYPIRPNDFGEEGSYAHYDRRQAGE